MKCDTIRHLIASNWWNQPIRLLKKTFLWIMLNLCFYVAVDCINEEVLGTILTYTVPNHIFIFRLLNFYSISWISTQKFISYRWTKCSVLWFELLLILDKLVLYKPIQIWPQWPQVHIRSDRHWKQYTTKSLL
jgi:hypothetical protein